MPIGEPEAILAAAGGAGMVLAVQGAVGNPKAREYLTPAAMSGVAGPRPPTPPSYNYLPTYISLLIRNL